MLPKTANRTVAFSLFNHTKDVLWIEIVKMFFKHKFWRHSDLNVPPQVHHDLDCLHGLSQHPLTFTTKGKPEVGLSATSVIRIWSFQHVTPSLKLFFHRPLWPPPLLFYQLFFYSGTAYNYVIFHSILPFTILYLVSIPFCLSFFPPPRLSSTIFPLLN